MVVALGGYYGFKNAGDEAMLLSLVSELKRRGHEPWVLSAAPGETAREYEVQAFPRMRPLSLFRVFRRADYFLLGGGGLFQDRTSKRSLAYYLGLLRLARFLKTPAAAFGVSLGPLSPAGERAVARTLRSLPLVVRDRRSQAYARRLGLEAELGGDPALLLPAPELAREPGLVLLIPRYQVPVEPLVAAAERLHKLGFPVLALALQPGRDEAVLEAFRGIPKEATGDPKRALYLIRSAEYVVSARLHGMVLAAAAGTPYAGIAYDPKVEGFAEDTGAPLLPLRPDPREVVALVQSGRAPDWRAVNAARRRVRASLDRLLPAPTPAGDA